ncbi:MAG: NAD(P)-dependent oxidoreductase [Corynebacteriales bacterium]|nr:NAD(P)-dependent oxidoreductase [Mycobacteriales bacterium]
MRILVAGGSGAVGRPLVAQLLRAGHEVVATSRSEQRLVELRSIGAEAIHMNAVESASVMAAVEQAAPEVVIHQLTSLAEGELAEHGRVRREGTQHLVEAAKSAGVDRFVAQSLAWVYAAGNDPADEQVPLDDTTVEPRASIVAGVRALEDAVRQIEHHVLLRYGIFYGPGTWNAPGGPIERQLRSGGLTGDRAEAVLGLVRADAAISSFVHVHDAASAAVEALSWPNGAVNIVDDEPAPASDWLPALAEALAVPPPPAVAGVDREGWQRGASNALARSLGWSPKYSSWRTGFAHQ